MNFICRYMSIVNIGGDMNTNEEKDIENVLKHVFENINSDEKIKAKNYLSNEDNALLFDKIFKDGDFNIEHYNLHLISNQKRLNNGLLKEKGIRTHQAIFLANNFSFVKSHLENMIVEKDGSSGCADKSRRLIKMYFNYFEYGMPLIEDILSENTLNNEEQAIEFFNAIYSLYYGQPKKYIEFLTK